MKLLLMKLLANEANRAECFIKLLAQEHLHHGRVVCSQMNGISLKYMLISMHQFTATMSTHNM